MAEDGRGLITKLEAALYAAGERLGTGKMVRTDSWVQLTTPNARTHFRNGVLRSILAPEALEPRIDETIAHYHALGVPFRWMVTPSTHPCDTAEALRRKGFERIEILHAMVADPSDFASPSDGEITVETIDAKGVDAWVARTGKGWGMDAAGIERFREELKQAITAPNPTAFYFLARYAGKPAGTSSLKLLQDFAHFNGAEVSEELRGRGIYKALVLERMRFLRDRGIRLVTNHCVSTTSAPICARLGFRRICDFEVFRFPR